MNGIGSVNSAAGYRLVRRLGSGRRADVFLGHASTGDVGGAGGGVAAQPATLTTAAAIKVFRPGTDPSHIDAEIGALARASSPHLMRLDDLATAPDNLPVLVLGLLRPQSLGRLLESRGRIASGEAVTILAPLAAAVAELHRSGVAHGAVTARSVLFDELGTPVLASFGHARIIGGEPAGPAASSLSPAELAASGEVLRDLADLTALAIAVLESTPESRGRTLALSFLRSADPSRAPERFADELAGVLFDSAPAAPVALVAAPRADLRPRRAASAHVPPEKLPTPSPPTPAVRGRRRARPLWLDALHLPDWLEQAVRSAVPSRTVSSGSRSRVVRMLASVRRPVWVATATVAVLLTTALVLVPGGDASSGGAGVGSAPVPPSANGTQGLGEAAPDSWGPAPPSVDPAEPVATPSALAGDDPVAAALTLLALRDGCLADLSVLCLDDVDQAGSAAWEADGYLIRQAQEGGGAAAVPVPPAGAWEERSASLVERIGNSALVAVAPPELGAGEVPVSVLLIRGVQGWRIRDLFVG